MSACPCGLPADYETCCAPFHTGSKVADTAEKLMRSRYSAFSKKVIDYLVKTHHPKTLGELDQAEMKQWAENSDWKKLEILRTEAGGPKDSEGEVEFKAYFQVGGADQVHHEKSVFKKVGSEWFFYDGKVVKESFVREAPKVGRNDPCPCGSGKKYKKCCLK